MHNCPNCGNQVPEGSRFCPNCGAPQGQMPPAYYPPPAKKAGIPTGLVVLVIVIVVLIILIGVGVLFVFSESTSGNVDMSSSGSSLYTANYTSSTPASGRDWVVVNVTMYNNRSYAIPVAWSFFTVDSGGESGCMAVTQLEGFYNPTGMVSPGQSSTFSVVFDVPEGSSPTELHFNGLIAEASCPVP